MASEMRQGASGVEEKPKGIADVKEQREESQTSDNDGGERPVRRKLKETSITSVPQSANPTSFPAEDSKEGTDSRASSRGRKRSFDDEEPENDDESAHRRKRSRSSNIEEDENEEKPTTPTDVERKESDTVADNASSKLMSPRRKRSRDQLDKTEASAGEKGDKEVTENEPSTEKTTTEGEPEKKRHRDDPQNKEGEEKVLLPNGFANTSSVSPFGALGSSKPATQEADASKKSQVTSSSAFASSSLAAFSGSEQSPFGSLGGSNTSVFKKKEEPETKETDKPKTGFAAAAGPSPFASAAPSGFGTMGSGFSGFSGGGFGAATKPSGGLTSFASPGGSSVLNSTSPAKAFGAADDDEGKEDTEEDNGPGEFEQDKTDERFFEREIETGEEEEKTYFSCKAKLYQFSDKEWRERGIGTFKVNVKLVNGKEDKKATRMIMRADGVGRVMLNTPLFKGMTVGDASGKEPKSKQIHLASFENGRSVPTLLRTGADENSKDLYRVVCDLLKEL